MRIPAFRIKRKQVIFDIDDLVEIVFGVFVGLFFFLGASELWNIGAALTDLAAFVIVVANFVLLYAIMKLITGRTKGSVLLESVKFPFARSAVVYTVGFAICSVAVVGLDSLGVISNFVVNASTSTIPAVLKIAIVANFLATLIGSTVDLSLVEK